ncbi:DUF4230 domain-containing protein [Mesobacillus jeotgali]|uniref:DUF4230 domain-containing protein n=1 Tax=Mesobacillus jeotgali TaxID=129985 RepID=A0ABY9VN34_9BACI|nr:DUF4230 domain-containing protein [Mesobacillus jeotgali]WNF24983.1 DUF4230 domain-containing protein [Mesobacillus jeotgali]
MEKNETIISKIDELSDEVRTASITRRHKKLPKRRQFATFLILFIFLSAGFVSSLWFIKESRGKAESTVYIEQVHDLATLATAEAHMKVIFQKEDNEIFGEKIPFHIPGTKRELLLIVPATVIAGVDLQAIEQKDMKVDEEKKIIELVLPKASFLQEPSIKMDQVRTFSDEGIFRGKIEWDEGFDLAAEAQDQIKQEAIDSGILLKAEENAETVLKEFFGQMGYKVIIKKT